LETDALTEAKLSKAYSIHLQYINHYAIHFINYNVRQSQAFNGVILSQIIQLIQV